MPTVAEILQRYDFLDSAVVRHGFVDYMRDYELLVAIPFNNAAGRGETWHRYQFVGCVEAQYGTQLPPASFIKSLPDEFVLAGPDYPDKDDPDGFIWGVRYSTAYPGPAYRHDGERARHWSSLLGRPMHEVVLQTEAFELRLVSR